MTKLSKAQEKRFDEKFLSIDDSDHFIMDVTPSEMKQHLADELAIQKKEIIEKLEKEKILSLDINTSANGSKNIDKFGEYTMEYHNIILDQAIETIKND